MLLSTETDDSDLKSHLNFTIPYISNPIVIAMHSRENYVESIKNIKDRKIDGPNISLGEGDVNFEACFEALKKIRYEGLMILETMYYEDPLMDARKNLDFVKSLILIKSINNEIDIINIHKIKSNVPFVLQRK